MASLERLELLATVADLYYLQRRSQAEIARRIGYSRSAVSRLLTEAHERQLVEIRVNHPLERDTSLEHALRRRFDVETILVAQRSHPEYDRMLSMLGRLGASYLDEKLVESCVIGISWGNAVYELAGALQPRYLPGTEVVQMVGGLGSGDQKTDGPSVAIRLADKLGGRAYTLNAPLIATDEAMRDSLLAMRAVRETLNHALRARFALVGIGSMETARSGLVRAGYVEQRELEIIQAEGAVGDIAGTYFDRDGHILDLPINRRTVAIDLSQLRATDCRVIAVAGGRAKAEAVAGALRGRLIDTLITDSNAALTILSGV